MANNPYLVSYLTGNAVAPIGGVMPTDTGSISPTQFDSSTTGGSSLMGLGPEMLKSIMQNNQIGLGMSDKLDSMYGSSTSPVPVTPAQNQWAQQQYARLGLT